MTQPIKRKKVFVSRAIQGRILARIVKYWLVCSLSLWHALFLIELARYTIPGLGTRAPRFSPLEAYAQFASQHATLLIASALVFPVILWDMLKLTHQIAGPLVRFEHTLRKMTAGEPVQKIVLRDGDLLVEFQEVFNTFLTSGPWLDAQKVGAENQTEPGSQEAAVLASVAALDADLNSQPTEPAVAR